MMANESRPSRYASFRSTTQMNSRPLRFSQDAARNLFHGFAVADDESRDFLASLVSSGTPAREEIDTLYDVGLLSGVEDWVLMMRCAQSMLQSRQTSTRDCDGNTIFFACFDTLLDGEVSRAAQVEAGVAYGDQIEGASKRKRQRKQGQTRKEKAPLRSHFWADESDSPPTKIATAVETHRSPRKRLKTDQDRPPLRNVTQTSPAVDPARHCTPDGEAKTLTDGRRKQDLDHVDDFTASAPQPPPVSKTKQGSRIVSSRFFAPQSTPSQSRGEPNPVGAEDSSSAPSSPCARKSRPPRGTVSSLPFPPLSAPRFGLIQEELAHDPFQLLVAVRLLIKTAGKAAIPTFKKLIERFPTPADIVAADRADILEMIRHLGLGSVRADAIQRYARLWVEDPPSREVRHGVKNYPKMGDGQHVRAGQRFGPEDEPDGGGEEMERRKMNDSAWEIGHITQGPYAIDSWRIFCRDVLLGRATSWTGEGQSPEFQPEWMRVLPADKELRAYLRWMWMREGWDFDPATGDREVLSEELRLAVDEGRVGYDDSGRLRILEVAPAPG